MKSNNLIYSERCWVDGQLQPATIKIVDGKIADIFFEKMDGAADLGDKIMMPAVLDAHVHINEPGRTHWEGFNTATMAAAAGGIGTIIDMPLNSEPVTTNVAAFEQKQAAAAGKLQVNVGFYGGLIPGNSMDMEVLCRSGVMGIKCFLTHSGIDTFPNVKQEDLEVAMPIIAKSGLPLLVHCELDDPHHTSALQENPGSYQAYLAGRPAEWEHKAIEMMIGLCKKYQCRTHIVHVSSAGSLSMIAAAKKEGLPLTAETCPHYLLFCAENIPDKNTLYKCAPPIRDRQNNNQLIQALASGVLDFISTDHSPAPPADKEIESGDLQKAWGGIAGLQFLLSSAFTAVRNHIRLEKFIPLLTENPAAFLGLHSQKGWMKKGYDADLVIWDPSDCFSVEQEAILHRHKLSPYTGLQLYGKIFQTYVNGILVFDQDTIKNKNAGQCLLKK